MIEPYCKKERYEALYGSYLRSDPNELLDAAGISPDGWKHRKVLDLCGGNGRLSVAARQRGADVTMLDADFEMCDRTELNIKQGIKLFFDDVGHALRTRFGNMWLYYPPKFDVVFCQQAVNYWIWKPSLLDLVINMDKDGVFVFNTFNTLPSTVPTFREHDMGDHMEYEAFCFANGFVHHVQLREGYEPHKTSFRWIPPDEFDRMLVPHFEVERRTAGRTDIYVCRLKEEKNEQ
jgi:hypothetical protein